MKNKNIKKILKRFVNKEELYVEFILTDGQFDVLSASQNRTPYIGFILWLRKQDQFVDKSVRFTDIMRAFSISIGWTDDHIPIKKIKSWVCDYISLTGVNYEMTDETVTIKSNRS